MMNVLVLIVKYCTERERVMFYVTYNSATVCSLECIQDVKGGQVRKFKNDSPVTVVNSEVKIKRSRSAIHNFCNSRSDSLLVCLFFIQKKLCTLINIHGCKCTQIS